MYATGSHQLETPSERFSTSFHSNALQRDRPSTSGAGLDGVRQSSRFS
ncbi:uncharacterized protein RCO7_14027 [Rhynchosporium graminicola]|uniref:Uncharacterized protein n=1 Tax=Rhynchosporium graminicola TaxID=2792576 RepID=A0A1E1KFP8_9HELO|nr:uncharacterized protein RCO7_14027 [Rhynchosporium commune]